MSRSPIPSIISVSVALAACSSGGNAKPDAYCGTGGASPTGLSATAGAATLTYGNLTGGLNNDCPDAMAPAGVISMTIEGQQQGGSGLITFCIKRPDLLPGGQALGTQVKVVDVTGAGAGCTFILDNAGTPSGTVSSTGECNNGSASTGFALVVDGTVSLSRTCGTTTDTITATLSGTVAVAAQ